MNDRNWALEWADSGLSTEPTAVLGAEVRRLHARVESLRGLCKTAVGALHDAGCDDKAHKISKLIGDMEKPLPPIVEKVK